MNNIFVVITVQVKDRDILAEELKHNNIDFEGQLCLFLLGIISGICNKMEVKILKSESFEKGKSLAIIFHADVTNSLISIEELRQMLEMAGDKVFATVRMQKEELFRYMHRI